MEPAPEDSGEMVLTVEEREDLRVLYDNTGETRNTDILIRWAISAVMFALNSALLPFTTPQLLRGEFLGQVMGMGHFFFMLLWFLLERRMQGLITYWNDTLIAIEDLLRPRIRVFGGEYYRRRVTSAWITTHRILLGMIWLLGFILAAIAIGYLHSAPTNPMALPQTPPAIEQTLEGLKQEFLHMEERHKSMLERLTLLSPKPTPPRKGGRR